MNVKPNTVNKGVLVLAGIWLAAVAAGNYVLLEYSFTPGTPADTISEWPDGSQLHLSEQLPTLVMIAHPHCSCTRASISELARLMSRLHGRVSTRVVFIKPAALGDDWERTDLWESAVLIPGVDVIADVDGSEAELFGAKTSGQTFLYATDGRLLFAGGITATRGHEGDSIGKQRIIALVREGETDRTVSSVFGCPLDDLEASQTINKSTLHKLEFALGAKD